MKHNPDIHHRRSIRLKGYNYSSEGSYYITICTHVGADSISAQNLFGEIIVVGADSISAQMELNHAGKMIETIYNETINTYKNVSSNIYVIMPNHLHCIVSISRVGIESASRADMESAPTTTVADIMQSFKRNTTIKYINGVKSGIYPSFNKRIWQRNYYEHIICDEVDYEQKRHYISQNPMKWTEDELSRREIQAGNIPH